MFGPWDMGSCFVPPILTERIVIEKQELLLRDRDALQATLLAEL